MFMSILLNRGDPSLSLRMTGHQVVKEGKEMAIRIVIVTCGKFLPNRHFFPPSNPNSSVIPNDSEGSPEFSRS
jgi:hypothetical protein